MKVQSIREPSALDAFFNTLEARMPGENLEVQASVGAIVKAVRSQGLSALLELRERFEGVSQANPLIYDYEYFAKRAHDCPSAVRQALRVSIERVRRYHDIQKDTTRVLCEGNSFLASHVQPLDAAALYVPGGKAFYPSSLIMSAVPAQVAGVQRIGLFTPARGIADPVFAATVVELGIQHIYAVGGAQAVAAATFGVAGIPRFDKIVGPGNIYVATAKQMLAGRIGIDSFAGPSEILVLSDGSSPANWIAADLLAQAEHDEEASSVLVTTDESEPARVEAALAALLPSLGDRQEIATKSLERFGALVVVADRPALLAVANRLNAEHLHLHTACALTDEGYAFWSQGLRGVGAVFFGRYSAESFGDYLAGPSHVLPTAGTARFSSPLGVYDFLRRTSHIKLDAKTASELAATTAVFARSERLWAHAFSAELRSNSTDA